MNISVKPVSDPTFRPYGRVVTGIRTDALLDQIKAVTPKPENSTVYEAGDRTLEALPCCRELSDHTFGGMPIEIGYCNGSNTKLNCLEYHRCSEINIPADDMILLLARMEELEEDILDTSKVRAFFVPAGTVVELYATTLHYAPCESKLGQGFRVAVVLPCGTNTKKPDFKPLNREDTLLTANNKWLLAHPDSAEAKQGCVVGLKGENIDITPLIT